MTVSLRVMCEFSRLWLRATDGQVAKATEELEWRFKGGGEVVEDGCKAAEENVD